MPGSEIDKVIQGKEAQSVIEILPENHRAVQAFCHAGTQWTLTPEGRLWGLNYPAAEIAWRRLGIELSADDFGRIQTMERAAIRANCSS